MTFDELSQHAEETGKAVSATDMAAGQMAVVLRWNGVLGVNDRTPGALVARTADEDMRALMTVKPSPRGYPSLGGGWSRSQLAEVTVLIIEPEFPFEVQQ